MPKPKYILFDFWNTLMKTTLDREAGVRGLLELAGNPPNITVETVTALADELIESTKTIQSEASMEFSRRQFDHNMFERLGISINISQEELDLEFIENQLEQKPEPGAKDMLTHLRQTGIRTGIVSNSVLGGNALSYILEQHGMYDSFDFVMTSADYGFRKPHPQIFITALAKAGTSKKDTWFVGDWIHQDIIGAQKAGLTSVWYNPNKYKNETEDVKPNFEISHWDELTGLFS